jgi:hypothetical protein
MSERERELVAEELPPSDTDDDDDGLDGQSPSIGERLRRKRTLIAEQKTHDIDIPGYEGELFCRYRLISGPDVDKIVKRVRATVQDKSQRQTVAIQDTLIEACEEFWLREDGREYPLREHPDVANHDIPVKYDGKLAEFLAFADELSERRGAREVVLGLFGGNDLAMAAHGTRLSQWMTRLGTEVDFELGEV